jgi:hypothetical protein
MQPAMAITGLRSALRARRFAWLLALSFWLPVAQWSAATHALLHLGAATSSVAGDKRDLPVPLPDGCELCVVAAALGAGGAPPAPPAVVVAALPAHAAPAAAAVIARDSEPFLSYRSRAPPLPHA